MKSAAPLVPLAALASLFMASACLAAAQESTKEFETRDAHVTLHSGQPEMHFGPPPDFAQLDLDRDGSISVAEAKAGYDLLYIDFEFADHNRNGRVSRAEYEHWRQAGGESGKR